MTAGKYTIVCEQGATLLRTFTWTDSDGDPVSLVDCSALLQVRSEPSSADVLLELTSDEGGGLTLGGVAGTIAVEVDAETTLAMDQGGWYDLLVTLADTTTRRLLQGRWIIEPCTSRVDEEDPAP